MALHQFLVANRSLIKNFFFILEILTVLLIGVVFVALSQGYISFGLVYEIGLKFGVLTLGWYILSLLPGMISRLKVSPMLSAALMLFRRQFGVMMFLSAVSHYLYVFLFGVIVEGFPLIFSPGTAAGFMAMFVAMFLWITSNDYAQRGLGKWWKRVHYLTYVVLFLIMAHLILFMQSWTLLLGAVMVLELLSWIMYWRSKLMTAPPNPDNM